MLEVGRGWSYEYGERRRASQKETTTELLVKNEEFVLCAVCVRRITVSVWLSAEW